MKSLLDNKKLKKHQKNNDLKLLFNVEKNGQVIQRCYTKSKRRFYNRLASINWQNGPLNVYLRVSYGRKMTNKGIVEAFWNDGHYTNKEDLMYMYRAFTEPALIHEFRG